MSIVSWSLSKGFFPQEANVPCTTINVCLYMRSLPLKTDLESLFDSHLLRTRGYERMRSVPLGWRWRQVEVTVQDHFTEHTVQSADDLHKAIEALMDRPFDTSRPRWEVHLMAAADSSEGSSSCLLIRIDHSIADGLGILMLLHRCGFIKAENGQVLPLPDLIGIRRDTRAPSIDAADGDAHESEVTEAKEATEASEVSGDDSRWTKVEPLAPGLVTGRMKRTWVEWAMGVFQFSKAVVAALGDSMGRFDSDFYFNGSLDRRKNLKYGRRKLVTFPPLRLSYLKAVKSAVGGVSLTDVLLTILTGALRRCVTEMQDSKAKIGTSLGGRLGWVVDRYGSLVGDPLTQSEDGTTLLRSLTAMVLPRSLDEDVPADRVLRNGFVLVSTQLPIHIADPKDRLRQMAQTTARLKTRHQQMATYTLMATVGPVAPWWFTSKTCLDLFSRHSLVVSNVPGPKELCTFCDKPVHDVQVVYPNLVPQLMFVSYAGRLRTNFVIDPDLWPQHHQLGSFIVAEALELAKSVGVTQGHPLED
ncbi:unnamed protein product [Vitrella brassicaformis CCMP3155]|uniref:Uncharacterized protein n=2 Tax=Vitrella brassicaformis TaxID=1169539 RepID=A0A0G4EKL4_VITBC|nr:unnamed protein product [Vitrella brassicaformis CCMP3155]|eukprot:CEL96964.1 unnamed protein product [Vitrella brassicaformis CCMP3155]